MLSFFLWVKLMFETSDQNTILSKELLFFYKF